MSARAYTMAVIFVAGAWLFACEPVIAQTNNPYKINYGEITKLETGHFRLQLKEKQVSLDQLLEELKKDDREARLNAVRAIAWPDSWPAKDSTTLIKALGERLKDNDVAVQYHAVEALSRVGPEAVAVLAALMDTAKSKEALIRGTAIRAVLKIGPKAKDATPGLIAALEDEQKLIAETASFALGNIGPEAVPSLIGALSNAKAQVRAEASMALAIIGPPAKAAVPALRKLLSDPDKTVALQARLAIDEIEETPGRPIRIFPGRIDHGKSQEQEFCNLSN